MILKSLRQHPERVVASTRPYLEALPGYDPARHRQEAAMFVRWALEIGVRNSSRPALQRRLWAWQVAMGWRMLRRRRGPFPCDYSLRRREALSTVWNICLYTDDGATLAPVSVTTRMAGLFVTAILRRTDHGANAAVLPVLRGHFEELVMPLCPNLQPRPDWVRAF